MLVEKLLTEYSTFSSKKLRIKSLNELNRSEHVAEQHYWKEFYISFTSYLYEEKGAFDNYVGMIIKLIRAFFNYLNNEKGLNIGSFHKNFYVTSEEIEIIVLSHERLSFLINSEEFEKKLSPGLQKVKDIFVFGCTTTLRYSDLQNLKTYNVEIVNNSTYLSVHSQKTNTFTKVKLPEYAIEIIKKYGGMQKQFLLPRINKFNMNQRLKKLMELAGFTEPLLITRKKRGIPFRIYKEGNKNTPLRFCDCVSTHTMRRTGITTMLVLGMSEQMVRKISGHAPNSKEFYKYVSYVQSYLDKEIDLVHEKLSKKVPEML